MNIKKLQEEIKTLKKIVQESYHPKDDMLGGFTFEELIDTVNANEQVKDEKAIRKVFNELVKAKVHDAEYDLRANMKDLLKQVNQKDTAYDESSNINEATTPEQRIEKIRDIVAQKQYSKVDGVTVDLTTASLIIQIYDALNDVNKKKFSSLPIKRMVDTAYKLAK